MAAPIDAGDVALRLRAALAEAEAFVRAMPVGKEGVLFLRDGVAVQPDPAQLGLYEEFGGRRYGVWPGSSEISSAMLGRYSQVNRERTGEDLIAAMQEAPHRGDIEPRSEPINVRDVDL